MNEPLFTVIIPTFNRTRFLCEAIESVIAQTWTDWQLIVIDDGSDPPVEPLVRLFGDSRIKYFHQRNQGLGAARQRGVELALGTFLCYLDDDDFLLPDHLTVIATSFHKRGKPEQLYKVGMLSEQPGGVRLKGTLFNNDLPALPQHWQRTVGIFPYAIPRRLAIREPSINFYLAEDFNWLGRLMLLAPVHQIDTYSCVFRLHDTNRTNVLRARGALEARLEAVRHLYSVVGVDRQITGELYRKVLTHHCWHWSRQCIRARRWSDAWWGWRRGLSTFGPDSIKELGYTSLTILRTLFR